MKEVATRTKAVVESVSRTAGDHASTDENVSHDPQPWDGGIRIYIDPTIPPAAEVTREIREYCRECVPLLRSDKADLSFLINSDAAGKMSWTVFENVGGSIVGQGQQESIHGAVKEAVESIRRDIQNVIARRKDKRQ